MKRALTITAALLVGLLWGHIFIQWRSVPDLHFSVSEQKCVRIIPPEAGTCDQPPPKYHTIFVH